MIPEIRYQLRRLRRSLGRLERELDATERVGSLFRHDARRHLERVHGERGARLRRRLRELGAVTDPRR